MKNRNFKIKSNALVTILNDLLSMGVYVGSSNPLRILPYTETSADVAFLQTHVGCQHNTCTFCPFYKDLKFEEKSEKQIFSEIDQISDYYRHQNDRNVSRVMLLDADAVNMNYYKFVRILRHLRSQFPLFKKRAAKILHWDEDGDCFYHEQLEDNSSMVEISSFVHTTTILNKGTDFFKNLKEEGLTMLWWGVESGCVELLRAVGKVNSNKSNNDDYHLDILKASQILKSAEIFYVTMIIVGLGGERYYNSHLNQTRYLLEKLQPPGVALSNLFINRNSDFSYQIEKGELDILSPQRMRLQREALESAVEDSIQFDYELEHHSEYANNITSYISNQSSS